jgi:hypothetical protein
MDIIERGKNIKVTSGFAEIYPMEYMLISGVSLSMKMEAN